jgi:hypothetical protein
VPSQVGLEIAQRIAAAPVEPAPFPHIYSGEAFPAAAYAELQRMLPPPEQFAPIQEKRNVSAYPERSILKLHPKHLAQLQEPYRSYWTGVCEWLLGGHIATALLDKFGDQVRARFSGGKQLKVAEEALLVHDRSRYTLGPHTDSPQKVVSLLFYLPPDESLADLGTSLYAPRQAGFSCAGGPHYKFELFERVRTMPFMPNSLFAFPKTASSFHGVEPITRAAVQRYLLLYDLRNPAVS